MRSPDRRQIDAKRGIVSGGGGRSVKSYSRKTVEFRLTEALPAGVPDKSKYRLRENLALLIASTLICLMMFGFSTKAETNFTVPGIPSTLLAWSQAAKSGESSQVGQQFVDDSAFSALNSFAQQIGAEAPKLATAKSDQQFDDQTFSALRDFAQQMGVVQPESTKGEPKLADADNLMDFLRQGGAPAQSPATSTGPVAGGKHPKVPVEATFVGEKVCMTCHASQAASFEQTLMGRIGKTQKGQVRLRELPRSGIGAREGRRRTRRRRDHLVPAGRSSAHGGREQRRLPHLP